MSKLPIGDLLHDSVSPCKLTFVGMMKMEMIKLGDLCYPSRGQIKERPDTIIDYIDISAIDNNSKTISGYQTMAFGEAPSRARKAVEKGNILVSTVRPNLNAIAILEADTPNMTVASTGFCVLECKESVDKRFVFNYCKSKAFIDELVSQATGASYPAVSDKIVREAPVPRYSYVEQKRIGETLDKACLIIQKRKSQLADLDDLIKARFVEMFGDPASNPMEWMETTVGKECYYIKDGPHKSLPDIGKENGGHPFISVRNIVNHVIDFSTARYVSDEDYADARKKCCPVKGDMLYSKGGTTGIAKLIDVDVEFANWVHLAVLKFDRNVLDGLFFENMLNCAYCYDQSQRLTKGIANRDLVLSAMAQIKMYRPPMELQQQFAAFVSQIDKSKSAIQRPLIR